MAIKNIKKLGVLINKNVFLAVLVAGKSKIHRMANSVPVENILPGVQISTFLLYTYMVEREHSGLFIPLEGTVLRFSRVLIPNLFGTRNWFDGTQFFHRLGAGDGFRIIQVHYIYFVLYLYFYYISST